MHMLVAISDVVCQHPQTSDAYRLAGLVDDGME